MVSFASLSRLLLQSTLTVVGHPHRSAAHSVRILSSLLGKSGPKLKAVQARSQMSVEATNRRELLKVLITSGDVSSGEVRNKGAFAFL